MSRSTLGALTSALDFKLSELLKFDLGFGIVGAVGAGLIAVNWPQAVIDTAPWVAGIIVVMIGAVIAGLSVLVAFLDQPFLRKIRAIGRDPVRYLAPFLFTAVLGIVSLLPLVVVANLAATDSPILLVSLDAVAGLLTCWTIASVLPALDTLVQFVHLKVDALDVSDDIGKEAGRFDRRNAGGERT